MANHIFFSKKGQLSRLESLVWTERKDLIKGIFKWYMGTLTLAIEKLKFQKYVKLQGHRVKMLVHVPTERF